MIFPEDLAGTFSKLQVKFLSFISHVSLGSIFLIVKPFGIVSLKITLLRSYLADEFLYL